MIKKYFINIFLRSGLLILILFLAVLAVFLSFRGKTIENKPEANISSSLPSAKQLILYSISGKIKSIENNKIQLETLTIDSMTKPLSEKKLETRELEVNKDVKFIRLIFVPRNKNVKMPENPNVDSFGSLEKFKAENTLASFNDLKIGDNISADYSDDLTELKNFTPNTITILPYSVF